MKAMRWLFRTATMTAVSAIVGCGQQQSILHHDASHGFSDAVRIYQTNCQTCHGSYLQGEIGPSLQHVGAKLTPAQIDHMIRYGAGPMTGYGQESQGILTNAQIRTLIQWLSTKK